MASQENSTRGASQLAVPQTPKQPAKTKAASAMAAGSSTVPGWSGPNDPGYRCIAFASTIEERDTHLQRHPGQTAAAGANRLQERPGFDCMHLKVVYEKDHTGFEETKDFPIVVNTLIADRYQVASS